MWFALLLACNTPEKPPAPDAPVVDAPAAPVPAAPAPAAPPPPAPGLAKCATAADCVYNDYLGTCRVGKSQPQKPLLVEGIACDCRKEECKPMRYLPVACETWKDCSWTKEPVLHPTSALELARPVDHPVEMCKDGEVDAICAEHVCKIVVGSC